MIVRRTRFYRLAEVFFDEDADEVEADVVEYFQRPTPVGGSRCADFHTIHLDLTRDEDSLFAAFSRSCRYNVRRAERDDLTETRAVSAGRDIVGEFVAFFDRFAAGKGLPRAPAGRLAQIAAAGQLDLSSVAANGQTLVWHAYLRAGSRARQLHSASLFRERDDSSARNLIGRANRYLHWQDIRHYKGAGLPLFDFGGWYAGRDDHDLLRINAFKEEFGGSIVREFHCAVARSMRGRLVLLGRQLRKR
jgi:hypothetical protein